MSLQYIDEADASLNRGTVASGETIHEGELVVADDGEDGNVYRRADPSAGETPIGIVVHDSGGDSIVEHDEDYVDYDDLWKYEAGEDFYYQPLASVDNIMPPSMTDNGTDPAPSFLEGSIVGYVTINGETEIVEEGYTDDAGDTYNDDGGAGDWVALGRVDQRPQETRIGSSFGIRVPTRLDADLYAQ